MSKLLVFNTDLDDSLCTSAEYMAKFFPTLLDELAAFTGFERTILAQDLQFAFDSIGSNQDHCLVDLMPSLAQHPHLADLMVLEQELDAKLKAKYLRLYDGAAELLTAVNDAKIPVNVVTNGSVERAAEKLVALDIVHQISLLIGQKARIESKHPVKIIKVAEVKPHVNLEEILGLTREELRKTAMLGDLERTDIALARRFGQRAYLAQYGARDTEKVKHILGGFKNKAGAKKKDIYEDDHGFTLQPVDHPKEVLTDLIANGWL